MENLETYWDLTMKDGTVIPVRSEHVLEIKRQMRESKHLITADWTKNVSDIKSFEKTSRLINAPTAIASGNEDDEEGAAKAFHTPLYTEDGSVRAKWVKRQVNRREWTSTYSKISSYKILEDNSQYVVMAFRMPIHYIDDAHVTPLTDIELDKLY